MKKLILFNSIFALCFSTVASSAEFSFEADHSLPLVYVSIALKGGATQDPDREKWGD